MSSKTWRSGVVEEQLVEAGLCARARSVEVSLLDLESDAVARLTISAKISICTDTAVDNFGTLSGNTLRFVCE